MLLQSKKIKIPILNKNVSKWTKGSNIVSNSFAAA
jgi:hypothetical protein